MLSAASSKSRYWMRLATAMPLLSVGIFILNALDMTLPLVFGLITREFFDVLSGAKASGWEMGIGVWWLVALFLLNRVLVQITEICAAGSSAYFYYVLETMLRRNVFRTIMRAVGFSAPASSGEIADRMDEDTAAISETLFVGTYGSGSIVAAIVAVWILASINIPLTIVALLPTLISVITVNMMGPRLEQYHKEARESSEDVSGLLTQLLNSVQAVKVAGAESDVVARFDSLGQRRQEATIRNVVLNTLVRSMDETTIRLTTGLLLIFAAGLMRAGSFTVGDLALFVAYVSVGGGLSEVVQIVGRLMRNLKQANVSLDRLFELVPLTDRPQLAAVDPMRIRGEALPLQPGVLAHDQHEPLEALTVTGLSYQHPGSDRGIYDINLTLKRGEVTVITGRIGAGKSVLVQTILGLLPATSGELRWNGEAVAEPAAFLVPPRCAYTPQTPRLFSDTLVANILMGMDVDDDRLQQAIQTAVLEPDIAQLEDGLETLVGPRGVKLSGGQIQRTAAARMFLRQPELLVFDDLSSALDVETEQLLWERLFALPKRPACLVISHRQAVLQRAHQLVVLKDGRIEDIGSLDVVLGRSKEMQSLWDDNG